MSQPKALSDLCVCGHEMGSHHRLERSFSKCRETVNASGGMVKKAGTKKWIPTPASMAGHPIICRCDGFKRNVR